MAVQGQLQILRHRIGSGQPLLGVIQYQQQQQQPRRPRGSCHGKQYGVGLQDYAPLVDKYGSAQVIVLWCESQST